MKECNLKLSKTLQELGYNLGATSYYLPDGTLKNVDLQVMNDEPLYEGDDAIPAPRLDDAAHFLLKNFGALITVEPFIYNGVIYNFIAKIYAPSILENEPEHMNGIKVCDCNGKYFLGYDEALETAIEKAIQIIKSK